VRGTLRTHPPRRPLQVAGSRVGEGGHGAEGPGHQAGQGTALHPLVSLHQGFRLAEPACGV
jgi:hypothetical protein